MYTFTAVGVGPGDPELITLKAIRAIQAANILFVPRTRDGSVGKAQQLVQPYVQKGLQIVELPLPMVRNSNQLVSEWENGASLIHQACLDLQADQAVYPLLGDPLLYSTYGYLRNALLNIEPSINTGVIPGIPGYAALSAAADLDLAATGDRVAILPASYEQSAKEIDALLKSFETVIFYKVGKKLPEILEILTELPQTFELAYGEEIGFENEFISTKIADLQNRMGPYLSLLQVSRKRGIDPITDTPAEPN